MGLPHNLDRLGKWCENLLVSQSTHPFSVDYFSIWDDGGDQSRAFALEFKVKPSPEIIQAIWERAKSFPDPYLKMTRWQLFSERVVHTLTPLEDSRNE